jgi:serine/threonine-protein kinase
VAKPEEIDLLHVAESISDGAPVDWARLQPAAGDVHASVMLRQMAVLERIASFHRADEKSGTPTDEHPAARVDAAVEQQVWGHFRLLDKIGEGSFGVVYRAQDSKLESEVALKLLLSTGTRAARVLKEARLLARVQHPNVVRVYGTDQIDGRVGIWMEFVKGRTLASLLQAHGPFGAREAAGIGVDLCRALAAVHGAGVMHGDLKAHNVMREAGGRTVLMDFGTGKDLAADLQLKDEGSDDFAGTPLYVAPEVFDGQPRTRLSEMYSLGVLLYHLVTNAYPVDGRSRSELERAHRNHERKRLRDARPDLPEEFIYAVERAISVDPRERYASAGAFEAALARCTGGGTELQPAPRRWTPMGLAAGIGALAIVAGTMYTLGQRWMDTPASRASAASARLLAAPAAPATAPVVPAAASESAYQIDTALYRVRGDSERRLLPGERVAPGDGLFVKLRVSVPAYVYIVNEDDQDESYLLFPLPGQSVTNPVPPGIINRIPGASDGGDYNWQVTSAGGREHFLIFASPERLPAFEKIFAGLPRPQIGRSVHQARLGADALSRLRGVGGLTAARPSANTSPLAQLFPTPLGETEETARGLWVRQLTVENPATSR